MRLAILSLIFAFIKNNMTNTPPIKPVIVKLTIIAISQYIESQ